jgi:hypothetical protein
MLVGGYVLARAGEREQDESARTSMREPSG